MKGIKTILMLAALWTFMPIAFTSCSHDKDIEIEPDSEKINDSEKSDSEKTDSENPNDIHVKVNDDGTTSNGSIFSAIDDKNFYLDYIKYTVKEGHLYVSGYDKTGFKGTANIVSSITYKGNTYEVLEVGNEAFKNCQFLTSVVIGNSVTTIGDYAFCNCYSSLTSVVIGNSVTSIGRDAFGDCESLTSVVIGNSVTTIGDFAFIACTSLTSINIPDGVTSIGYATFEGCSALTSVVIGNGVTSIGEYAFDECSSLTSINIPDGVTSIGDCAFAYCSSLMSINIPRNVTSIGDHAFTSCPSITSMTVSEGNPVYDSRKGCNAIIETASNTLIAGCMSTIIPNSVTSIGYCAFAGCSSLTSINIPKSVTSIGNSAFIVCSSLTSIDIPSSVTNIGGAAFEGCKSLTTVNIPESVTSIGLQAFNRCSSLTTIICRAENVPELGDDAFSNVPQNNATLYVPASALDVYKAADQWKDFGTILPI